VWEHIRISGSGISVPVFGRNDDLFCMAIQPGTPPRKRGVGNDMMAAAGHEPQIFIICGLIVEVDKNGFISAEKI
jgi:hypothetical protein